jgi:hypothetical protein
MDQIQRGKKIMNIYDQQNNWQFVSPVILGIKRHLKHRWMYLSIVMSSAVLIGIHVKENLCRFYSERYSICYFHQSTLHCSPVFFMILCANSHAYYR